MKNLKTLIIAGLIGVSFFSLPALALEDKATSFSKDLETTTGEGEGSKLCEFLPWICVGTDGNGGGKEPGGFTDGTIRRS